MKSPSRNARPGQRYARHARRRHTSVPTTASPSRHSPSSKKPVATSQWTASEGGRTLLLEVLQGPRGSVNGVRGGVGEPVRDGEVREGDADRGDSETRKCGGVQPGCRQRPPAG